MRISYDKWIIRMYSDSRKSFTRSLSVGRHTRLRQIYELTLVMKTCEQRSQNRFLQLSHPGRAMLAWFVHREIERGSRELHCLQRNPHSSQKNFPQKPNWHWYKVRSATKAPQSSHSPLYSTSSGKYRTEKATLKDKEAIWGSWLVFLFSKQTGIFCILPRLRHSRQGSVWIG